MSEQPVLPPQDEAPVPLTPAATPPPVAATPRGNTLPWLYGLGFVILAAAIFYLWQHPRTAAETADNASAIQAIEHHLADIDGRLARLEQRPSVDLGKTNARLDNLEQRVLDQTQLASRLDILSGRIESLSGRDQTALDQTKQQLDVLATRVAGVESSTTSLDAVSKRMNRIAKLQQAAFALSTGQPIGDLPGAPEALARYARVAPPTEEQLRLRFLRDEQGALAANQPGASDGPFMRRVWDRAESLVTIRQGDDVVIGNPAAVVLSHAHAALDVGDVAGAVSQIDGLKGQPAQAMAAWLVDAKALLAARSALTNMANQV